MTSKFNDMLSEEEISEFNQKYIDWQKKFVDGEQNILISNEGAEYHLELQYYWEDCNVYNILKPIVDSWGDLDVWGQGKSVDQLIPYQKQYNKYMNQISSMIRQLNAPIMYVEDGSVDIDELSEEGLSPGKIIVYRQGSKCPILEPITSREDIEFIKQCAKELREEMIQLANALYLNMEKI